MRKNKHTLFLFALLAFSSVSASAQLSLGYYQFKDGSEYTGELKGRRPNGKGKTVFRNGDVYEGEYVKGKRQVKVPTLSATEKSTWESGTKTGSTARERIIS